MTIIPAEPSAIVPPAPERGPLRFDPAQAPRAAQSLLRLHKAASKRRNHAAGSKGAWTSSPR